MKTNTTLNTINIAKQFSRKPGPRYIEDGQNSGEQFYKQFLAEKLDLLKQGAKLKIILDGGYGYGPSFLSESFGKLGYELKKNGVDMFDVITFITKENPSLIDLIKYHVSTYGNENDSNN